MSPLIVDALSTRSILEPFESIQTTGDRYTVGRGALAELLEAVQDDELKESGNGPYGTVPQGALENRMVEPKMEAAGIEPASAVAPNRASTSVVRA